MVLTLVGCAPSISMIFIILLATDELAAFGLTEPNHGSDPGGMETEASVDPELILVGHTMSNFDVSVFFNILLYCSYW